MDITIERKIPGDGRLREIFSLPKNHQVSVVITNPNNLPSPTITRMGKTDEFILLFAPTCRREKVELFIQSREPEKTTEPETQKTAVPTPVPNSNQTLKSRFLFAINPVAPRSLKAWFARTAFGFVILFTLMVIFQLNNWNWPGRVMQAFNVNLWADMTAKAIQSDKTKEVVNQIFNNHPFFESEEAKKLSENLGETNLKDLYAVAWPDLLVRKKPFVAMTHSMAIEACENEINGRLPSGFEMGELLKSGITRLRVSLPPFEWVADSKSIWSDDYQLFTDPEAILIYKSNVRELSLSEGVALDQIGAVWGGKRDDDQSADTSDSGFRNRLKNQIRVNYAYPPESYIKSQFLWMDGDEKAKFRCVREVERPIAEEAEGTHVRS